MFFQPGQSQRRGIPTVQISRNGRPFEAASSWRCPLESRDVILLVRIATKQRDKPRVGPTYPRLKSRIEQCEASEGVSFRVFGVSFGTELRDKG